MSEALTEEQHNTAPLNGGDAMSEAWFVKCVDSEILHTELNAFAQQGYTIRWLFQQEWQGTLWITIVAERKQAQP